MGYLGRPGQSCPLLQASCDAPPPLPDGEEGGWLAELGGAVTNAWTVEAPGQGTGVDALKAQLQGDAAAAEILTQWCTQTRLAGEGKKQSIVPDRLLKSFEAVFSEFHGFQKEWEGDASPSNEEKEEEFEEEGD